MERDRFIEVAPYYYALGIASVFKEFYWDYTTKVTIRSKFWGEHNQETDPDELYNYLQSDVLFDKAISILVEHEMILVTPDEFGPDLYKKAPNFDSGWQTLTDDKTLPFYKFGIGAQHWLLDALTSVNRYYEELGIKPSNFETRDMEWEPLPLNREDPALQQLTERLDETIELVRTDNGYSATMPEERQHVLESLGNAARRFKTSDYISWGYIQRNVLEPTRTLLRRFKDTAIGIASAGVRSALETWVKNNAIDLLNQLFRYFGSQ
jgi:hypothetical protein